jgi:amino acid transporter
VAPTEHASQVLQRHFSRWSTISYAISILGVLGSVPATFGAPMSSGGPATAVWAWLIGSIMAYCIASSGTVYAPLLLPFTNTGNQVAELVSAYPTAGGMYYVTKHVVPPEHVAAWAWIIGWCNFLGQAAGVASLAYTISQMILATVVMRTFDQGDNVFVP